MRFNKNIELKRHRFVIISFLDICNIDRDSGPCRAYFVKYYYERNTGRCEPFVYGGCGGNGNRFSSINECEHICVTHDEKRPNITNTGIFVPYFIINNFLNKISKGVQYWTSVYLLKITNNFRDFLSFPRSY